MKNNIKRALTLIAASVIICANLTAFATSVPKKTESTGTQDKYASDTQKVINTVKETTSEVKEKTEPTPTPTVKATQKATEKATEKPTEKATQKATEKAVTTTTKPEKTETVEDEIEEEDNVIVVEDMDEKPTLNVVTNPEKISSKRYLTKGGAFGMFLLTVLVSAVVSFLISYRFYKMSRPDSHLQAEIRALRRDIDAKMSGSVGGFSEYETKTTNSNPSYARPERPIRRTTHTEDGAQSADMYSKWEGQINLPRNTERATDTRNSSSSAHSQRRLRTGKKQTTTEKIIDKVTGFLSKRK